MNLYLVPTESRATMQAYREGLSLDEYIDAIWKRRQAEHGGADKAKGKWPCLVYSQDEKSNVTAMRRKAKP